MNNKIRQLRVMFEDTGAERGNAMDLVFLVPAAAEDLPLEMLLAAVVSETPIAEAVGSILVSVN